MGENPKFEYRNPKQIRRMKKTEKEAIVTAVNFFWYSDFGVVSKFGFRIYFTSAGSRARR